MRAFVILLILCNTTAYSHAQSYSVADASDWESSELSEIVSAIALIETKKGEFVATGAFVGSSRVLTSALALAGLKCQDLQIKTKLKQELTYGRPPRVRGITAQCRQITLNDSGSDIALIEVSGRNRSKLPVSRQAKVSSFDLIGYITRGFLAQARNCNVIPTRGVNNSFSDTDRKGVRFSFNLGQKWVADCVASDPDLRGAPVLSGVADGRPVVVGVFQKSVHLQSVMRNTRAITVVLPGQESSITGFPPPEGFNGPLRDYFDGLHPVQIITPIPESVTAINLSEGSE
ncbi:MAG: hypothetical protein HY537_16930 [Deltaproteobacteria bacterium]|nr:hypothetical protein [Deltaproteobacteria bacterium]